ncbi:hypothetical protein ACVOMV_07165 [Mesorhizobium atlanticum]
MLTTQDMDRKIDEHFGFEASDNVEGVLRTLSEDVEHDVVGWPFGPSHGRDAARAFYEATFSDSGGKLGQLHQEALRRRFPCRRVAMAGPRARAGRLGLKVAIGLWSSGCSMS